LIVVITSFYLPAGNYVDVFKGGRDADYEKYVKEPGVRVKLSIQKQAEPDAESNSQSSGNSHAGYHGKTSEQLFFVAFHICRALAEVLSPFRHLRRYGLKNKQPIMQLI
jgi:hypothetical protein